MEIYWKKTQFLDDYKKAILFMFHGSWPSSTWGIPFTSPQNFLQPLFGGACILCIIHQPLCPPLLKVSRNLKQLKLWQGFETGIHVQTCICKKNGSHACILRKGAADSDHDRLIFVLRFTAQTECSVKK